MKGFAITSSVISGIAALFGFWPFIFLTGWLIKHGLAGLGLGKDNIFSDLTVLGLRLLSFLYLIVVPR